MVLRVLREEINNNLRYKEGKMGRELMERFVRTTNRIAVRLNWRIITTASQDSEDSVVIARIRHKQKILRLMSAD